MSFVNRSARSRPVFLNLATAQEAWGGSGARSRLRLQPLVAKLEWDCFSFSNLSLQSLTRAQHCSQAGLGSLLYHEAGLADFHTR